MPLDPVAMRNNNFDGIAPYYDLLARIVFGKSILESQLLHSSRIPRRSRILILGGGTGQLLPALLEKDPVLVTYLEPSGKMLEQAKARVSPRSPVDFVRGSVECLKPHETYDVVITPFVLDIFSASELTRYMKKLTSVLSDQGLWLFTDFYISSSPKRFWQVAFVNFMYLFFKFTCNIETSHLLDFERFFGSHRLRPVESKWLFGGVIVSRVYRFEEKEA